MPDNQWEHAVLIGAPGGEKVTTRGEKEEDLEAGGLDNLLSKGLINEHESGGHLPA